jgi:hypothetical protein
VHSESANVPVSHMRQSYIQPRIYGYAHDIRIGTYVPMNIPIHALHTYARTCVRSTYGLIHCIAAWLTNVGTYARRCVCVSLLGTYEYTYRRTPCIRACVIDKYITYVHTICAQTSAVHSKIRYQTCCVNAWTAKLHTRVLICIAKTRYVRTLYSHIRSIPPSVHFLYVHAMHAIPFITCITKTQRNYAKRVRSDHKT